MFLQHINRLTLIAFVSFIMVLTTTTTFAQDNAQAINDAKQMKQLAAKYGAQQYRVLLQPQGFSGMPDEQVEAGRKWLSEIEAFETTELAELTQFLTQFEKRYGADRRTIGDSFKHVNGEVSNPSFSWSELKELVEKPAKTRQQMCENLVSRAATHLTIVDSFERKNPGEVFEQARAFLQLALEFEPGDETAAARLAEIDGKKTSFLKAKSQEIDEKKFGSHSANFQGPGNADALAAAVKTYLSTNDDGSVSKSILAVRIAGDWQVAERAILRDEVQTWGLPVHVAYRQKDDSKTARVVSLTMVTRDSKQAPPFKHQYVGDSWYVRTANLPAQSSGVGFIGTLIRLSLSVLLVAIGLVLAQPVVTQRFPQVGHVYEQTKMYWPLLGVIALGSGVGAFILSILSPFGDILPQAAAVVAGVYLGLEVLLRKTPELNKSADGAAAVENAKETAMAAVGKAQDILRENANNIRQLSQFSIPLGGICVALGLMHLVLGNWILV